MRVLMTADAVGGVWTYALELAAGLAVADVDVTLAVLGSPVEPARRREARGAGVAGLYEAPFRLEWMDDPWDDVERAGEWLVALEQDVRPDVVHLNGFAHGALPWQAPVLVVAHSCVLSWWEAVRGEAAPPEWDRYREAVETGIAGADALVAPTRAMLDAVERLYAPQCRVHVIPNGRRAVAPLRAKKRFVLGAGRLWDEAKNLDALDRVAPRLSWPVCVAGPMKGPDGQRADAASLNVLGPLPQARLLDWLAAASVFAAPARYEPFGLAPLEAAQARCALVLGDIPSLREIWDDAALYAAPHDDETLAAELDRVVRDDELRRDLGERAFRRAQAYTPARMADTYGALYRELALRHGPVRGEQEVPA